MPCNACQAAAIVAHLQLHLASLDRALIPVAGQRLVGSRGVLRQAAAKSVIITRLVHTDRVESPTTIWIKSALVGLAPAFVTLMAVLVAMFASIDVGEGVLVAISILSVPVLLPVIIAFALGFWWSVRRARRNRSLPSG